MKIITKSVMVWNEELQKYVTIYEESEDYYGPVASCGGGGKDGGGGAPAPVAPTPPDPAVTAAAQGGQDRSTAQTNAVLLNPEIHSPYGTVTYDTNSYNVDPNQTNINRPVQTTTLAPAQQQRLDATNLISNYVANAGINWAQMLPNGPVRNTSPATPSTIDYSNVSAIPSMNDYQSQANAAAKANYDSQYALMQPDMDKQQRMLQDQLVNSGNPMGSEGYGSQMDAYQRNRDSSLQNLANSSVNQGYNVQNQLFNAANATRQNQITQDQLPYNTANMIASNQIAQDQNLQNQNINALSALLQGKEAITMPQGAGYAQQPLTAPNIMQMASQNYANQMQGYNTQMNAYNQQQQQGYNSGNAMMSGLFSLGSAGLGLFG